MSPVALKIATPYGRALFELANKEEKVHLISKDLKNVKDFLNSKSSFEFKKYLNSPIISQKVKCEILTQVLKKIDKKIHSITLDFLVFLISRGRINLIEEIIYKYFKLVFKKSNVKEIEIITAFKISTLQYCEICYELTDLSNVKGLEVKLTVDPNVIGGVLIKTESKILDFTIKNQLQNLAKHLNSTLEI